MKIACIINKITVSGGAERVMCELANGLAARGHEVHLITRDVPKGDNYSVTDAVVLKNTSVKCKIPVIRNVFRNISLHKMLKKNHYDVAVSFITSMNIQAIISAIGTGVPMVISERVDPSIYKGTVTGFGRGLTYPLADGFVFQTDEAQRFFSKKIQDHSTVIPNPILTAMPEKADYKKTGRIVTVGRLTNQKNYPLMLHAFAEFHKTHPDYRLEIYGKGNLLNSLKALAASLSIENSVQFMGQRSDVHECMKDADMFIMTSDYEGMSNALAEAMVIGLPCIATDCRGGGSSFLLEHDVSGLLLPLGSQSAVVEALQQLADNEALRLRLGKGAKQIKEKLDRDRIFDMWEAYLEQVANSQ